METKKYTVFVVEDEELLLQAIVKKLQLSGLATVSTTTGQQALDYLTSLTDLPDLVWLDYYLKDMTGLDVLHAIRTNPRWQDIPVIIVSNSASEEKVHNLLALGAKKYIVKAQARLDDIVDEATKLIISKND